LGDYGVSQDRLIVVEPGTDAAPLARGSHSTEVQLLCVAAVIPRKGHEVLFEALCTIRDLRWRLTCVGSLDRDPATTERLRRFMAREGPADRVTLVGELKDARLTEHSAAADLFVLPTLHEGYGMAVAEALARGLPVVSTRTGAIGDLIGGDPPAGWLVPA